MAGVARIGCSGWEYDDWRGVVYPADLPKRAWFAWYAERFDTVEVNGTFYGLPAPDTFERWRGAAPPGFTYTLKLSGFGTHRKRLKDPDMWLPTFVERAERLGPTLGPILVQLPPRWRANPERLDAFLAAATHGKTRTLQGLPPLAGANPEELRMLGRWAVEVRDADWLRDEVYDVLRRYGAALVWHDLLPGHPEVVTASWVYVRFHGPDALTRPYAGSYPRAVLAAWATRLQAHLAEGRDVYAYFNNDIGGAAIDDARTMRALLARGSPLT